MKISILGTEYTIIKKKYDEDEAFVKRSIDGYCDGWLQHIVHCDMTTHPDWKQELPKTILIVERQTLRHEIIHAFLNESGLQESAGIPQYSWARNEEMVDWFALQFPKIHKAFEAAGCLR